ncbi:hypothetical protein N7478_000259 [Penicillium angulare]|uniref:uncharacterized protein n=1 Tax=Penicillium angulare TaxID=116970 RepID=UPI00253F6833|nr:uncharacterized protein N7478_000259 [Penicillium angulare]KAJ5291008.1 hypothetical protein N7478_000259 [Penicillium angulare]
MEKEQNTRSPTTRETPWLDPHTEEYLEMVKSSNQGANTAHATTKQIELLDRIHELIEETGVVTPQEKPKHVCLYWNFLRMENGWEWSIDEIRERMSQDKREWEMRVGHRFLEPGESSPNS